MEIQGSLEVRIPLPNSQPLEVGFDIVKEDNPLLIGMEVMGAGCLILDFCVRIIRQRGGNCSLPMKKRTVICLLNGREEKSATHMAI